MLSMKYSNTEPRVVTPTGRLNDKARAYFEKGKVRRRRRRRHAVLYTGL